MRVDLKKIQEMYGNSEDNWGDLDNFQGNYINFGLWKNIEINNPNTLISVEQRVKSSQELYLEILQLLDISITDEVLEIGCGRAMGIIQLLSMVNCKKIYGLDICKSQLERSRKNIIDICGSLEPLIELINTAASKTKLPSNSIDKIYSVEVAQHFPSLNFFAKEMSRVIRPNGKIVFTSYFPTHAKHLSELKHLLPLIELNLENITPIYKILEYFINAGFKHVCCKSIGNQVFYGYDRWIAQNKATSYQYYEAYRSGYIDYYIFSMIK